MIAGSLPDGSGALRLSPAGTGLLAGTGQFGRSARTLATCGAGGGCHTRRGAVALYRWDADLVRDDLSSIRGLVVACQEGEQVVRSNHWGGSKTVRMAWRQGKNPAGPGTVSAQVWAEDWERRKEAGVPGDVSFRTKPRLAQEMLERALEAGVPFAWVTGDAVYGSDRRLRMWLEQKGMSHRAGHATSSCGSAGKGPPPSEGGPVSSG